MKCIYCGCDMILEDCYDFNFKGNKDNYWSCDNCKGSAFEKIRYDKTIYIEYIREGDSNGYIIYR